MVAILKCLLSIIVILISFTNSSSQVSENMSLLGQWHDSLIPSFQGITYNDIWGWESPVDDQVYAIVGTSESTLFIDITDPSNPILSDVVDGEHPRCIHRDFKTFRNYAYGVADQGRTSTLQVFDLSFLPDSVSLVYNSNEFFVRSHNIFIDQPAGRLYAVGCNTQLDGVIVLDLLEDPAKPKLISSLDLGEYTHDIHVKNDTAYLSNGTRGLVILDFTDANNPIELGSLRVYPEQGYNHSSWLNENGTKLVMADETHGKSMKVVDVTDFETMKVSSLFKSDLLGPVITNSIPHNPFVIGDYAVVSYYHDGVQVYDISDAENPIRAAYYDTYPDNDNYSGFRGCWGVYPFLSSGIIIATDISTGLYIMHTDFAFPNKVSADIVQNNVSCNLAGDGTIMITGRGGGNKYTYSWYNGVIGQTITDLSPGVYSFTLTDQWGFSFSDSLVITEPDDLSISAKITKSLCPDSEDGEISLQIRGGTPPYQYNWSNGSVDSISIKLSTGTQIAIIKDNNGCQKTDTIILSSENGYTESGFSYILNQADSKCQMIFTNTSMNYNSLSWDLDEFGFSDTEIDTLTVYNGLYTFCLEVSNDCGSEKYCEEIEIICSTEILEVSQNPWDIYPNPAKDFINITRSNTASTKEEQMSIYNNQGVRFYSSVLILENKIDISTWKPGIYSIKIIAKNKTESFNFIKL